MTNTNERLLCNALIRIGSLTTLTDRDLADLIGVGTPDARAARTELGDRGWTESLRPRGDGRSGEPFAVLRCSAAPALAELLGQPLSELRRELPVERAQLLARIGHRESTLGVNRLIALMARELRANGDGAVAAARSLPLPPRADRAEWPPRAEAEVRVRIGDEAATCYVAWDRAGAPDLHRNARVRQWVKWAARETDHAVAVPPLLVACAGDRELRAWDEALAEQLEAYGVPPIDVFLATVADVLRDGPLRAPWIVGGGGGERSFLEWMHWDRAVDEPDLLGGRVLPSLPKTEPGFRALLLTDRVPADGQASQQQSIASLAMGLDPGEMETVEWLARHKWLTASELLVLLDDQELALDRRLARLVRMQLVQSQEVVGLGGPLWFATPLTIAFLAARDQVPVSRYLASGAVSTPVNSEGELEIPRTLTHELGRNRAMIRLATVARQEGGRLLEWRNEAESTHWFRRNGTRFWIRPDASGVVMLGGSEMPFLLEYDRGTLSRRNLRAKLRAYDAYYAAGAWEASFDSEPITIFVCEDPVAEHRVASVAAEYRLDPRVLITNEHQILADITTGGRFLRPLWPALPARDGTGDAAAVAAEGR